MGMLLTSWGSLSCEEDNFGVDLLALFWAHILQREVSLPGPI